MNDILVHFTPQQGQRLRREQSQGRLPTVAYADAFGAAGAGGTLPYYLATAFDWVGLRSLLNTSCPLSMMCKDPFR